MQDVTQAQVRMRINVLQFTPTGVKCAFGPLVKNKLGREEVTKNKDSFSAKGDLVGDVFSGVKPITVIDLDSQPIKVGETRDVTLYPVDALSGVYAYAAANALLAVQHKFTLPITPTLLEKMAFEATLGKDSEGRIRIMKATDQMHNWDPFGEGTVIDLIGEPRSTKVKLYPTAKTNAYALTARDAWQTWQP